MTDLFGDAAQDGVDRCIICGRALTDPVSIAAGTGPICRGGQSIFGGPDRSGEHPAFTAAVADGVIFVRDLGEGRTVTNDAEWVIWKLGAIGFNTRDLPVIYQDTDGMWDQLLVRNRTFAGFVPLRAATCAEAREQLRVAQVAA